MGCEKQPWIEVPSVYVSAVAEVLQRPRITQTETESMPRALVESLIDYFSEDLGCDHSVNICTCNEAWVVDDLRLVLEGKRRCVMCAGDRQLWSEEVRQRKIAELGPSALDWDTESLGYYNCPACSGEGVTPL